MAQLTHRDLMKLQFCIRDIYACLDIERISSRIVSAVSKVIPSIVVLYGKYSYGKDVVDQSVFVEEMASHGDFERMDAFARHAHEHPFINILCFQRTRPHPFRNDMERALRKQPLGLTAVKISDVLKDRQFHSLALFNEFFRPNGIKYQLGMPVSCGNGFHTAVCFNRDKLDFSEKDRLMLNLIGPHIIQAYGNAESYAKARDAKGVLGRMVEGKGHSLLKSLGLSFREVEVLRWAAEGKTNYEIAIILNIAPGTVKVHLEKIYRKLDVGNRMAAARVALGSLMQTAQSETPPARAGGLSGGKPSD